MQVHAFENNGYRILLDVCSGSVHVVDGIIYDAVVFVNGLLGSEEEKQKITELTPGGRFRMIFPEERWSMPKIARIVSVLPLPTSP